MRLKLAGPNNAASEVTPIGPQAGAALETALRYHEDTKHHLHRYARSLGCLKWEDQPEPFREFPGAPRLALPLSREETPLSYQDLFSHGPREFQALSLSTLGRFFEFSLALSAWKEIPGARWSLRINPSSGNLHPTEAYALLPATENFGLGSGAYHYVSRDHALELRSRWKGPAASGGFYLALTSIPWRESWKYGERAFRYCLHDLGHALASVCFAASLLGWNARLQAASPEYLIWLLGLEPPAHPLEPEVPEALVWIQVDPARAGFVLPTPDTKIEWLGRPNQLSPGHQAWPVINEVVAATSPLKQPAPAPKNTSSWPHPNPVPCVAPAERIIRRRRSALSLDGATPLPQAAFFQILDSTLPRTQTPPFCLWNFPPRVHLVLWVHRVIGLEHGLYVWVRNLDHLDELQKAFHPEFRWQCEQPESCPLFELEHGDVRQFARTVSCHQNIASDGAFSLGMLAHFEPTLQAEGAHAYRHLFWETGIIGQTLYLGAEAAGMRATGIGCFFDDEVHTALGLTSRTWQSLYHFTVGCPVEDPRLRSIPPYGSETAA